jgi:hypothetical protein
MPPAAKTVHTLAERACLTTMPPPVTLTASTSGRSSEPNRRKKPASRTPRSRGPGSWGFKEGW